MNSENDLIEAFRDEALELLAEIDLSLILLNNKNNSGHINTLFRALHTIKGSGSMFGLTEIVNFSHAFETVFDRIRKGTAIINEDIINLSLKAGDALRHLLLNTDTPDISGRGVGMDVVKKNVEKLHGTITLESRENAGTTVSLFLPLTLAIIEGILTRTGENFYILNLSDVKECLGLTKEVTDNICENHLINLRGHTVPFIRLREQFNINGNAAEIETMVIVESEGKKIGLVVDHVTGKYQSVIKPLSAAVKKTPGITGASILGDGSVALILDVHEIIREKSFCKKQENK